MKESDNRLKGIESGFFKYGSINRSEALRDNMVTFKNKKCYYYGVGCNSSCHLFIFSGSRDNLNQSNHKDARKLGCFKYTYFDTPSLPKIKIL